MNSRLFTLVLFLAIILVVIWVNKPSGIDQKLLKKEFEYRHKIDSVQAKYKELLKEDSITFVEYQKLFYKWQKAEENAKAWERKYNREKANNRTFTESELDSLVSAIR